MTSKPLYVDPPRAARFEVCHCSDHSHVHIVLYDDDDKAFAQFTAARNNIEHLVGEAEEVFTTPDGDDAKEEPK